jgi:hypothetical protein
MSERHSEIASRLADAMNMVRAASVGHGASVDIPELRDLLVDVEADLQAMTASGSLPIDINGARRAVSRIIQGLTVPSWDQVDPEVSEAMADFLTSMRADQIGP